MFLLIEMGQFSKKPYGSKKKKRPLNRYEIAAIEQASARNCSDSGQQSSSSSMSLPPNKPPSNAPGSDVQMNSDEKPLN